MTENKRFTYMKQFNGFCDVYDNGKLLSCMRLDYVDKTVNLLNDLAEENGQLKKVLGAILLEVKRDISNTNQTGEIKVFINPNSFDLISEVLREYGALREDGMND